MKLYYYFLIAILFLACKKKEADYILTISEIKDLIVTSHNKSVQANYKSQETITETVYLDLNNDGINDIKGISYAFLDSIKEYQHYNTKIIINNENFIFPTYKNSGERSSILRETTFKYDGTFPVVTNIYDIMCGVFPNAEWNQSTHDTPKYLLPEEYLKENDYDWIYSHGLTLKYSAFRSISSEISLGGDSILFSEVNYPAPCISLPENESIFLPFLMETISRKKYGWLELSLKDNSICFIRSAIQN